MRPRRSHKVCLPQAAKKQDDFRWRRIRQRKYLSGCQCIICGPSAHKLCTQQTASPLSENPMDFQASKRAASRRRRLFSHLPQPLLPPAVKNPLDFSPRLYFPGKTRYNRKKREEVGLWRPYRWRWDGAATPFTSAAACWSRRRSCCARWVWAAGPSSATTRWQPCTALRWPAAPAGRW